MKLILSTFLFLTFFTLNNCLEHPKVNISAYYETLCPGCRHSFLTNLMRAHQEIGDFLNIELVPYGNARAYENNGRYQFVCQHGEEECFGNSFQGCALKIHSFEDTFKLVYCMFNQPDFSQARTTARRCCKELKMDYDEIKKCVDSEEGYKIMVEMYKKTANLDPPHKWVPWDTVNDQYVGSDLTDYICANYLSDQQVEACTDSMRCYKN